MHDQTSTGTKPGWSPDTGPVLAAVNVTKHFPVHGKDAGRLGSRRVVHALDAASIGVYQGRVTALVGESGSGKSTLARVLAGLYRRTSGEVLLRGQPVRATHGRAFRRHTDEVQLILQDPYGAFNPMLRVSTHLRRAVQVHEPELRGNALRSRTRELLEQVQLRPPASSLTSSRTSCPAASCNASRSPAPSPRGPRYCSPTSRCPTSTSPSGLACSTCSPSSPGTQRPALCDA